jgi:beta-galactosidase
MNYRGSVTINLSAMKPIVRLAAAAVLGLASLPAIAQPGPPAHTFTIQGDQFLLDGRPFKVLSGELHYARIPREYWHARLKMARAMGLNTIATYVFWNVHEPSPGQYNFSGNADLVAFIKAAQEEGLYVILRAGPYSCAEWELGGYPAWLLKDPRMSTALRTNDPAFMVPVERWINRLAQETAPLQIGRGGPILITQVENEYGSWAEHDSAPPDPNHTYMTHMRDIFVRAGFTDSLLDTVDGGEELALGGIPGVFTGVNFGVGSSKKEIALLAAFQPNKPLLVTEYWPGWFDYWGHPHQTRPLQPQLDDLDYILSHGNGINLYMFHGGTSFGFMSGANLIDNKYLPQVTSYDYGAPLDEAGHPTPKFRDFRKIFAKYATCALSPLTTSAEAPYTSPKEASSRPERSGVEGPPHFLRTASTSQVKPAETSDEACLPPIPDPPTVITIPTITLTESTPLWANLPTPINSDTPKPMEHFDQAYGYILYRHQLPAAISGNLVLDELHDYAQIYLDGKLAGTLDRRHNQSTLPITTTGPARLDILVENSDRINFSPAMRDEIKGITKSVTLAGQPLTNWQIYPLPMDFEDVSSRPERSGVERPPHFSRTTTNPPGTPTFYRGHFTLTTTGDTFLDVRALTKGALWINGHPIGRFWNVGPQQTLYVPGPWLRAGENEIILFDLQPASPQPHVTGLANPILDAPVGETAPLNPPE